MNYLCNADWFINCNDVSAIKRTKWGSIIYMKNSSKEIYYRSPFEDMVKLLKGTDMSLGITKDGDLKSCQQDIISKVKNI
ncbi:hypothetical protein LCGC14_1224290 [marine sediment metagenome]|uniref:Uncharacterized protein n=1 Tax=marine sediment metagenome TaxID=412755 RepID=A0A0F9LEF7_9ZZZZ